MTVSHTYDILTAAQSSFWWLINSVLLLYPEDENISIFRNVGNCFLIDTACRGSRPESSAHTPAHKIMSLSSLVVSLLHCSRLHPDTTAVVSSTFIVLCTVAVCSCPIKAIKARFSSCALLLSAAALLKLLDFQGKKIQKYGRHLKVLGARGVDLKPFVN
jgi:hypothetical protein